MFKILAILLTSMVASAGNGDRPRANLCEDLFFQPIARTVMPSYPIEVRGPRGEFADDKHSLSQLKDGAYIFLITSYGDVIYNRKFDTAGYDRNQRGLVTHKSLLLKLEESFGSEIGQQIGGAGEFTITNGRVSVLSNRSGNFRGYQVHYNYSERILRQFGLPLEDATSRKILKEGDVEERGHTPQSMRVDEYILQMMSGMKASQFNKDVGAIFFDLHREIAALYPDEKMAGEFNQDKALDDIVIPMFKAQRFAAADAPVLIFSILFERRQPDGMEAALIRKLYLQNDADLTLEENELSRAKHRFRLLQAIEATMKEIGQVKGRAFETRPEWHELRLRLGRLIGSVRPS